MELFYFLLPFFFPSLFPYHTPNIAQASDNIILKMTGYGARDSFSVLLVPQVALERSGQFEALMALPQ